IGEQRERCVAVGAGRPQPVELGFRNESQIGHIRLETVADTFDPIRARRRRRIAVSWRPVRDAIDWLESRIGTRRGGATVFVLALGVFALRSVALPVIPGRDFGTYIGYYVQMWDWHSVVPMAMLFRTPLAPLVIGGTLDLFGGWGLLVVMALLFAASVVLWTR